MGETMSKYSFMRTAFFVYTFLGLQGCFYVDPPLINNTSRLPQAPIKINGGEFHMGYPGNDENALQRGNYIQNTPRRLIRVSDFEVARFPVTIADYAAFLNDTDMDSLDTYVFPWSHRYLRFEQGKWAPQEETFHERPMPCLTWSGAFEYCKWLTDDAFSYRLPTESEWEYLASNGGRTRFPWGNEKEIRPSLYDPELVAEGGLSSFPVGSIPENANQWGVMDLVGSVDQWCMDYFVVDAYSRLEGVDPALMDASLAEKVKSRINSGELIYERVARGGHAVPVGWSSHMTPRSYTRKRHCERPYHEEGSSGCAGFRWVRVPKIEFTPHNSLR